MRLDWFYENKTWAIASDEIRQGRIGPVVAVNVEEVACADSLDALIESWRSRLHQLFGVPMEEYSHQSEATRAVLWRFGGNIIARLFLSADSCGASPALNFEVIGRDASLIFHNSSGIANIHTASGACVLREEYSGADLRGIDTKLEPVRLGVLSLEHPHSTGNHFPALEHLSHIVQVAGIYDESAKRAAPWLQKFGARFYHSRDALLNDDSINAVLITSRNDQHPADAIAAARAGKDIFCDKPIAITLPDTLALVATCREAGVRFITTYPCRFHPAIQELKQRIERGEMGQIEAIAATNHGCMYLPNAPHWVLDPQRNGGGCIIDHTVHVADLMRYLTGQEFATVRTFAASSLHDIEAEDIAMSQGTMSGGAIFQIDSSWSRKATDPMWGDLTMRVVGTQGIASFDLYNNHKVEVLLPGGVEYRYTNPLTHQHGLIFVDYQKARASGERGDNADAIDGMRTMELVFACYESARKNELVTINLN